MMKCFALLSMTALLCTAAALQPLPSGSDTNLNRNDLLSRQNSKVHASAVFPGDTVIPALAAGPNLRLEMLFLGVSDKESGFTIRFFNADGSDLYLPLADNGTSRGGHIALKQGELFRLSTEKRESLIEGFAVMTPDVIGDLFGIVNRLVITGGDGVDRTVAFPPVSKYENRNVLLFDSREGRRPFAQIMNGSSLSTDVTVILHDGDGTVLATNRLTLAPYTAISVNLDEIYGFDPIARRSFYLETRATDFGVAVTGLETGLGFATLVPALCNPDWR